MLTVMLIAGAYGYLLGRLPAALLLGGLLAAYLAVLDAFVGLYSAAVLRGGSLGFAAGLLLALALIHTFMRPPVPLSHPLVLVLLGTGVYLGMRVGVLLSEPTTESSSPAGEGPGGLPKLLDSSTLVDGRIAEVVECGFLEGPLAVPGFVLDELQDMADSSDNLRRTRGRRGLDVLNRLTESQRLEVELIDRDVPGAEDVDSKLIVLARDMNAAILTNDFNLNKVATIQEVPILNVNDLSNAVKPAYIPGETFRTEIVRKGEEPDQGVGYLEDGTMVVVENAGDAVGRKLDVVVTSVIQTSAGRMIFTERGGDEDR